jgi:tetratricopeptide (TPR) repeat protein
LRGLGGLLQVQVDGAEPLPLTPNEQRLIDACAQFARLYPGTDKTRSAIYKSGYLLYSRYRFAEAAAQFNLVIQMDPKSADAERAANLILDSFAIRGDLEELKKNAKFYHDQPGLGSPRFKAEVFTVYQRASFQRIGEAVRAGLDPVAAADAYVAFYEEFLDTADAEVLPTALHNAAVHYTAGARHAEAMRARHLLVDDPRFGPRSKHYYVSVEALAYGYERIAAFDRAATYYEEVFALYPAERARVAKLDPNAAEAMVDRALDAIYSAAVFREAAGDLSEAIEDYGLFLAEVRRARPRDERANDVALRIAGLHEERGDLRQAGEAYYAFVTRAPRDTPYAYLTYATLRFGDLLTRQGQRDGARAAYRRAVDDYRVFIRAGGEPGEHTEHVSEMMFLLAQPELDDFLALRITAPRGLGRDAEDRALRAQLTRKRGELRRVEGLFKEIIATRSSRWSLAALVSMGRMQEDMIETLRSADVPRYLTEEQAAYYRGGLEDQAYQRKQAAIELYQLALGKAYELTLYNDDTAFARRRLAELAPDDFAGVEEALLPPRYVARRRSYGFEVEP